MNDFVQRALTSVITQMLGALRDIPNPVQSVVLTVQPDGMTTLTVNGEAIFLNDFAQQMFGRVVMGLTEVLKGFGGSWREITIEL